MLQAAHKHAEPQTDPKARRTTRTSRKDSRRPKQKPSRPPPPPPPPPPPSSLPGPPQPTVDHPHGFDDAAPSSQHHVTQSSESQSSHQHVLAAPIEESEPAVSTKELTESGGSRGHEGFQEESIAERLEKLELSLPQIDITEQEQNSNRQQRVDEVLALQAIFGEDFVIMEANEAEPEEYKVSIHVEVPSDMRVMVRLHDDPAESQKKNCSSASNEGSSCNLHACTLNFLPPIYLTYRLPISYPSRSPPNFILSARWLTRGMLSSLCQGLDSVWHEQVGDVVIYTWAEWLRTSWFLHLGITDELELDTQEQTNGDSRAFSGCFTPNVDIPWLIRYNEEQKNSEFLKCLHTCFICFTEQSGTSFVRLPCKHHFCNQCMEQYTKINVKEGAVKTLYCPDTSCKNAIPPSILKQLLGDEDFQRWESLLLQKTLDSMVDVVYCPRCELVCIEDEEHDAQCMGCLFSFCSLCRGPRHVGQECMPLDVRLEILKERQQGSSARRKKEQDMLNDLLSMKYVERETKPCPSCKMAITKSEGCNKMTCGNCGQYFCYRCNKAIEGYQHFRDGCVLFDEIDLQMWQAEMLNLPRHPQVQNQDGAQAWFPCPNCRQPNLKEGNNNHIFCWSCQQHFCALCRKVVRRSSEHYGLGPNKCKQHTNG